MPHDSRSAPAKVLIHPIKVKSKPIYLMLGLEVISLPTRRPLSFLVNALTFIEDKANICIKEKF